MYKGSRLYLNVPFSEKEKAKARGAQWDPNVKKWYCKATDDENIEDYFPFLRWMFDKRNSVLIVTRNLYIFESVRTCWKCGKETSVIALGVGNYVEFEIDDGELYIDDHFVDYVNAEEPIRLAWVDDESQIPPILLKYLKSNYNVRTSYSHTAGKCFANHCKFCKSIQGNHYIFEEPESPFYPYANSPDELLKNMQNIAIYNIALDDDLILDWTIYDFGNSHAYWKAHLIDDALFLDGKLDAYGYSNLYDL